MPPDRSIKDLPVVVGINAVAEAGYPDLVCPAIFLAGCNLRCPYCMNSKAVFGTDGMDFDDVVTSLKDYGESNVLVSGGEPCMHRGIESMMWLLKGSGFGVCLSTNGSYPDILLRLLRERMLVFVALDIKTNIFDFNPASNPLELSQDNGINHEYLSERVYRSLCYLDLYSKAGIIDCEVRTTLYPPFIGEKELMTMTKFLPKNIKWVLQQFRPTQNMMDPNAVHVVPYREDEIKNLMRIASLDGRKVYLRYP